MQQMWLICNFLISCLFELWFSYVVKGMKTQRFLYNLLQLAIFTKYLRTLLYKSKIYHKIIISYVHSNCLTNELLISIDAAILAVITLTWKSVGCKYKIIRMYRCNAFIQQFDLFLFSIN